MRKLLSVLLLVCTPLAAQDESPAVNTEEQPAVSTEIPVLTRPPRSAAPAEDGMTIFGEQESPIGLYIMPWRRSGATAGLDRPARLLEDELLPMDPEVFRRQVEYHRALTQHLKKTGRDAP